MLLQIDSEDADRIARGLRRDAERYGEEARKYEDLALQWEGMRRPTRASRNIAAQHRRTWRTYHERQRRLDELADSIIHQIEDDQRLRRLRREAGLREVVERPKCDVCMGLGVVAASHVDRAAGRTTPVLCPQCAGAGSGVAGD